jgi:uncharacterized membrane-anchored protein YhcB (DUF1043 family)
MIDKKLIELIYESLDGKLSVEGQRQLMDDLARNPDADRYYRDWQKIQAHIEKTREQIPDVQLAPEILKHLPMQSQTQPKPEPIIRTYFWNRLPFRFAMVFIAGIFLGFLIFTFFMPGFRSKPASEARMKGTMYDSRSFDQMKQADNVFFDNSMVKASFNVRYSTGVVEARITLSSLYPVKGVIEFDFNNFQVLNVNNINVNDQSNIIAAPNYIQINNVGDNQYIVQLINKNRLQHQVGIKILQNDVPIYQNAIVVNKE